MGFNLNYGRNVNNQIGIDYTIDDQTKQTSSTSTSSTATLDAMFVIHASRGIPNRFFKNLTKANAYAMFGEFTEKHGMQALACQRHLDLGLTATVLRIDDGGSMANYYPVITFTGQTSQVYMLAGELYNVTAAQVADGTFDTVLDALDMTSTEFLAAATQITIPVMKGSVTSGSLAGAETEDDVKTKSAAMYAEGAGSNGIKTRSIVPCVLHCPGAGKYGNKHKLTWASSYTVRNYVQTRTLVVYDATTEKSTTYSAVSMVPDKLDENNIPMYLGDKLRDKQVINDYLGDLNVRMTVDDTNKEGLVEAVVEYYTALLAALVVLMDENAALLAAGTGGDTELNAKIQTVINNYTTLLESIEDGDIHPWQLMGWDGNSIYTNAEGYNLMYLDSALFSTEFYLANGDDGLIKNMRTFSYDKANTAGTKTLADLYVDVFEGNVDANIMDIEEVESIITYDVDYPAAIRKSLIALTTHGVNTRGDMYVIGGMPTTVSDYDTALEYAKATKRTGSKYFMGTENAEVYDSNLYKSYRVNSAFLLIDALASWYTGDRKNSVGDYSMNPNIREGSLRPKIIKTDDINALYNYDCNTIKKVDGVYRLRSQMLGEYGSTTKLKELSNGINFGYLIKETHISINRHNKGTGDSALTTIKEKIAKDLSDFGKYFESTPAVTLSYADDDAEARGEADLNVTVAMGGTIKKFNVKFIVTNASASSTAS